MRDSRRAFPLLDCCCWDGGQSDGDRTVGGHAGGGGGLKAVNADDEALQPLKYNRLHCLTAEARITFSSLRVHFPHSVGTILMTTPSSNHRGLNLCHPFYYLGAFVNGRGGCWYSKLSFVYIQLSFIVGDLLCFTSCLLLVQTSHNSHDLIAMDPCIPDSHGPPAPPSAHTSQQLYAAAQSRHPFTLG